MFGIILGAVGAECTSSVAATPTQIEPTICAGRIRSASSALAKCTLRRYRRPHLQSQLGSDASSRSSVNSIVKLSSEIDYYRWHSDSRS